MTFIRDFYMPGSFLTLVRERGAINYSSPIKAIALYPNSVKAGTFSEEVSRKPYFGNGIPRRNTASTITSDDYANSRVVIPSGGTQKWSSKYSSASEEAKTVLMIL
ncbi:hypothetical protein CEXT_437561 [Caerostris extrusa]|uniref:Uncharacterized protein n=1 Tax=Caerostris extrusa TaxID=172846 RepID=A0AAV4NPH0_CAEEX|nr:hypothetical protein CEXT_437561 [Caerostris extrusa]